MPAPKAKAKAKAAAKAHPGPPVVPLAAFNQLQDDFAALQQQVNFPGGQGANDSDHESTVSSDTSDSDFVAPKICVPACIYTGKDSEYKAWKRTIELWYRTLKKHYNSRALGAQLMLALSPEVQDEVYATVPKGAEKYGRILKALDDAYGGFLVLDQQAAVQALRDCKRSDQSTLLGDFLAIYHTFIYARDNSVPAPSAWGENHTQGEGGIMF